MGWRRALCTSVPEDDAYKHKLDTKSLSLGSRFDGFFLNQSIHRPANSAPQSPKFHCKTRYSYGSSTPASSLRLSRNSQNRCEICLKSLKTEKGSAIFTAECRHSFHFPCVAARVRNQCYLTCPICNSRWKYTSPTQTHHHELKKIILKVYNDDEPLSSPTCGNSRFNPIPESDENEEKLEEFPGFFDDDDAKKAWKVEIGILSETAMVLVSKRSDTYAVVLKVKAPPVRAKHVRRAPIDLVTVLNVSKSMASEKLYLMKKAMRKVISSLSDPDRLSIVGFSTTSKRLLPLRRMTTAGKRAARRIIDAIIPLEDTASSAIDSLMKAVKVMEDRREKNPATSIMLLTDGHRGGAVLEKTLYSEITLLSVNLNAAATGLESFSDCIITNLLSVVVHDLKIQLGFMDAAAGCSISAIYSTHGGQSTFLGSGSNWCKLGELCSDEERQVLVELKVGTRHLRSLSLSIRCRYKDPSSQELLHDKEQKLLVPRPRAVVHHMFASGHGLNEQKKDEPEPQIEYKAEPISAWRVAERLAKIAIMKKSINRISDLHGFEDARF